MILWIWRLIVGCDHEYKYLTSYPVYNHNNRFVYNESVHRCNKCMKVRKDKI